MFKGHAEIDSLARCYGTIGQVLPGAKAAPGPRQQENAHAFGRFDLAQCSGDFLMHLDGKAVEPVRTI